MHSREAVCTTHISTKATGDHRFGPHGVWRPHHVIETNLCRSSLKPLSLIEVPAHTVIPHREPYRGAWPRPPEGSTRPGRPEPTALLHPPMERDVRLQCHRHITASRLLRLFTRPASFCLVPGVWPHRMDPARVWPEPGSFY
ncbi:hypothetical protein MHYP_G00218140 [Metynnis hypsauchen]